MSAVDRSLPSAVVVAASEEMRILLRGLLQLHRVRVLAEAHGMTEAIRLVGEHRPSLVVADAQLSEGSPGGLVSAARACDPGVRCILVAPAPHPPPDLPRESRPDCVLLKPFRIHQFAEALERRDGGGAAG